MVTYGVVRPAKSRSPLICLLTAACLVLLPALIWTQELLPCPTETQNRTVANTDDAATLASALECSDGVFTVEWFGDVVVSRTINITDGTSLNITGASFGATANGADTAQLFAVEDASSLHLTDMVLANGYADYGGAVYATDNATVSFSGNMVFTANTALWFGGAIYAYSSTVVWDDSGDTMFSDNNSSYYTGAIFAGGSSVFAWHGTMFLHKNTAKYRGGAVFATSSSNVSWSGNTTFAENTAWRGGAIYANSSATVLWVGGNANFSHNNAAYGGAIMAEASSTVSWDGVTVFNTNSADYYGGALFVNESSHIAWGSKTIFTANAAGHGGAIYANSSSVAWDSERTTFDNNVASSYGGTVMAELSSSISWNGVTVFMENNATFWGGGLYVSLFSDVSWAGNTTFSRNTGSDSGGLMIYWYSVGNWSGNTTFESNTVSDSGGGLNVHTGSSASWTGETTFTGNVGERGAAMFVWNANVSWTGVTTFADNVADLGGGAVYATINARIFCRGTTAFRNNTVTAGNGGAISIYGSTTTDRGSYIHISEDTTFANNYASAIGGAISSSASAGGQYFEDVTFRSNSASIGGAMATFDSGNANEAAAETTVCLGCQFIYNSAASSGLAVAAFGSVEINDSYFLGNVLSCDEGLYVEETMQEESSALRYDTVCDGCPSCDEYNGCTVENSNLSSICSIALEHTFADEPGTTLETLRIEPGYWRAVRNSSTISACYNEAACTGGQTGAEDFCKDGYTGSYCSVCQSGYSPSLSRTCTRCSPSRRRWFSALAGIVGDVAICATTVLSVYLVSTNLEERKITCFPVMVDQKVPVQALKSVVIVWQILTQFASVANVTYPGVYQDFLSSLNFINLDIGFALSAGCVWTGIDFHDRLIASTLCPLGLLGLLAMTYVIAMRRNVRPDDSVRETIRNKHLSAMILLLFFVYSSVSLTVFRTFACDPLDDGNEYLRSDYRILCTDKKHKSLEVYAGFMIAVYPVGIPLLFAFLLYRHRHFLSDSAVDKAATKPIASLLAPYRPGCFYYEIVECLRRVTLTGVVVFIFPNDSAQIAITILNSFFFFVVSEVLSPYKAASDTWLSRSGHIVIFFSMFDVLLLRVDVSRESSESQRAFAGVLVAVHVIMIVAVAAEATYACCRAILSRRVEEQRDPSQRALRTPGMLIGPEVEDEKQTEAEQEADREENNERRTNSVVEA